MSFIKASALGPLTASNTATIVDPQTPAGGNATLGPLVSFAAQNTTSGTNIDFIGIPSWAKRVTISLCEVSTNGTSPMLVRVGTSSGIVSTGYTITHLISNSGSPATLYTGSSSTDIYLRSGDNASDIKSGHIILTYVSSNTWVVSGLFKSGTAYFSSLAGSISLSATLDRVRLTTSNGTDTFDNGSANVMYE